VPAAFGEEFGNGDEVETLERMYLFSMRPYICVPQNLAGGAGIAATVSKRFAAVARLIQAPVNRPPPVSREQRRRRKGRALEFQHLVRPQAGLWATSPLMLP